MHYGGQGRSERGRIGCIDHPRGLAEVGVGVSVARNSDGGGVVFSQNRRKVRNRFGVSCKCFVVSSSVLERLLVTTDMILKGRLVAR